MTRVRLAATQKEQLGTTYIYNGSSLLYTFQALNLQSGEFKTATPDGAMHIMEVTDRGIIDMTSVEALQVMNILLRRTMKGLELQTVGRHLFDASSKVSVFCVWIEFILCKLKRKKNEKNENSKQIEKKTDLCACVGCSMVKWKIAFSLDIK